MHVRSILTGILPLLLGGALVTACDGGKDDKAADAKANVKADENKADAKADDVKADEAKTDEAKADDVKADDAKADGDAAAAGDAAADGDAAAGDAADGEEAAAEGADGDAAADAGADGDTKADDTKADAKKDAKKADPKKNDKKAEPAGPKIDAKDIFSKKCKSCHGSSGKADTKLGEKHKIEDWTVAGWKAKWSVSKIENIVTNGKANTKMKAFKDKLTPEEIKAVSKYSHSLGK